ncbi:MULTISPECIES: LysR family transcriptional regulator [Pseudomonas]|uniref:LysR family transcriptional regulator n=1 Tax=Pseudomonas auratipiscis TaxID=3115853 RepID=A0AB35WS19_9PSED|nr:MULTISPECIES: LysR family transcriptional regulator [unclassified Pseudomonas]MEE1864874.1 LysR family transcriptional regulator [Pseudomonas sp. 120P]MEE1956185.1 LysR family transcriptional regulator [Pseudomonas sp. 119P]
MPANALSELTFQDSRLKYLYISHQRGSMRAAADEFGVAASSISRHIAKLEQELNIELVKQGAHRVELTDAGKVVVEYYQTRLAHQQDLFSKMDDLRGQQQNLAVIAVGEGLLDAHAISSLNHFLREHRTLRTEIISAPSYEVQRMVAQDQAHLAVIFSPCPAAQFSKLFSLAQPLCLIVDRNHPLAGRTRVSLEDLSKTSLILPGPKFRVRELLDLACANIDLKIEPAIITNSLSVILDFVRTGAGATLLPERPVREELKSGALRAIPIDCPLMEHTEIQIVTRRSRRLPEVTQALALALAKALRTSPVR